jgi:hypothetical protein
MRTALPPPRDRDRRSAISPAPATSLASVYVDMSATSQAVHAAVAKIPVPRGVDNVWVDDRAVTDTFGCQIAVDLTGSFDHDTEGSAIARWYARELAALLGMEAHALYDLLRPDASKFLY